MGIRYDRDSQKRNDGPTIYFTDTNSLIMLSNALRSALDSNTPFYAYRRPGEMMITFGTSEIAVEGLHPGGFVIAPFLPSLPYLTIPYRRNVNDFTEQSFKIPFPESSTSSEDHRKEVKTIQEALKENGGGKIIAGRIIIEGGKVNVAVTLLQLLSSHPAAFVFCFFTPQTGCWLGASPELLLESKRGLLSTMALAGSRPSGFVGPWDEKNIEEQRMVADFISETLTSNDIIVEEGETVTRRAGKVEHICTPFFGEPRKPLNEKNLSILLHTLSPTPALCGLPRNLALKVIAECEKGGRGCYGGFCGPFNTPESFTFYAILRCARISNTDYCLYAGGGITLRSDAQKEWEETELKALTVRDAIVMK
ncbi:MAG: chorismate-binding protein [Muribaculaceae bacterium]|nr:chorismate-binding protein [Muribaculaceae bacterium]